LESLVKKSFICVKIEANDRTASCQSMLSFLEQKEANNFEKNKKKVKKFPQKAP